MPDDPPGRWVSAAASAAARGVGGGSHCPYPGVGRSGAGARFAPFAEAGAVPAGRSDADACAGRAAALVGVADACACGAGRHGRDKAASPVRRARVQSVLRRAWLSAPIGVGGTGGGDSGDEYASAGGESGGVASDVADGWGEGFEDRDRHQNGVRRRLERSAGDRAVSLAGRDRSRGGGAAHRAGAARRAGRQRRGAPGRCRAHAPLDGSLRPCVEHRVEHRDSQRRASRAAAERVRAPASWVSAGAGSGGPPAGSGRF